MGFDFSSTSLSSKKSANAIENKYPIGIPTEWDGKLSNFVCPPWTDESSLTPQQKSPTTAEVLLSITSRRSGIVYGQLTWQASGIRCPVTITQHEESYVSRSPDLGSPLNRLSILCQISTTEQVTIDATISNKGWAITGSAKSLPSSKLTLNQR
jgi:hypothetical protein